MNSGAACGSYTVSKSHHLVIKEMTIILFGNDWVESPVPQTLHCLVTPDPLFSPVKDASSWWLFQITPRPDWNWTFPNHTILPPP